MKTKLSLLLLLSLVLAACAAAPTATPTPDISALYSTAIERYFNASIHADMDELLDSIDKTSYVYPDEATIEEMRASADQYAMLGTATVSNLVVINETPATADTPATATVQATVYLSVDVYGDGNFQMQSGDISAELHLTDGVWRIFDMASLDTGQ